MRRELLLLEELIEAAEQAQQLIDGVSVDQLAGDRLRRDALLWNFTVATRHARTVIGELGLLLDVPRTATVVAHTDAVCWELTRQTFHAAIERGEPWASRLSLAIAAEPAGRFLDVRAELTRLDAAANGPAHRPAELEQLRTRLLAECAF